MRYTVHVCITFGYEPKTYIYVKDNKAIGKIKAKIQLDLNPLRHLKKNNTGKYKTLASNAFKIRSFNLSSCLCLVG